MAQAWREGGRPVWIANAASALAILACYGTTLVVVLLTAAGTAVAVHEGIWAGAIAVFAVAAFTATFFGYRRHGAIGPAILAGAGAALVMWALFASYDWRIELAGFIALALAAGWQWRAAHRTKGV